MRLEHRLGPLCAIIAIAVVLGASAALAAAGPINPYPREVLAREKVAEWPFVSGPAGWVAANGCRLEAAGGVLKITSTGIDP